MENSCHYCLGYTPPGSLYCPNCGAKLREQTPGLPPGIKRSSDIECPGCGRLATYGYRHCPYCARVLSVPGPFLHPLYTPDLSNDPPKRHQDYSKYLPGRTKPRPRPSLLMSIFFAFGFALVQYFVTMPVLYGSSENEFYLFFLTLSCMVALATVVAAAAELSYDDSSGIGLVTVLIMLVVTIPLVYFFAGCYLARRGT